MRQDIGCTLGRISDGTLRKFPVKKQKFTQANIFWDFLLNQVRKGLLTLRELMATACSPASAEASGSGGGSGMAESAVYGYTGNSPPKSCPFHVMKSILMLLFVFGTMTLSAQTKIHFNKSDGTSVEFRISDIDSIIFISPKPVYNPTYLIYQAVTDFTTNGKIMTDSVAKDRNISIFNDVMGDITFKKAADLNALVTYKTAEKNARAAAAIPDSIRTLNWGAYSGWANKADSVNLTSAVYAAAGQFPLKGQWLASSTTDSTALLALGVKPENLFLYHAPVVTPSNYTLNSGADLSGILSGIAADIAAGRPSNVAISFGAVSLSGDTQGADLGTLLAYRNTNPSVTFTGSLTIVAGADRAMLPDATLAALYNFGGKITQSGTAEFHIPNPDMNQLSFVLTGGAKVTRNRANDLNLSNFNVAVPDTTVLTSASGNSDGLTQYITNWYNNIGNTGLYQPVLWTNNVALNHVDDHTTLERMWDPNMDPFFVSNMQNGGAKIKIDGGTLIFRDLGWGNVGNVFESSLQYAAAIQRAGMSMVNMSGGPFTYEPGFTFNPNMPYPQSRVKRLADGTIVNMNDPRSGTNMVAVTLRSFCTKYGINMVSAGWSPGISMQFYCIVVPDYIYDTFASNPNWGGSLQMFLTNNANSADLISVPPNPYVISETMARNMGVTPHDVAFNKWDNYGIIQLTGNGR